MYKVFEIDDCFEEWATSTFLTGAESKEDLICHLPDIMTEKVGSKKFGKNFAKKIIKDEFRIQEIKNLFTDIPYTILNSNSYME